MRLSRLPAALLTLLMTITLALPAAAVSDEPWIIDGGGWGHGVGLSQHGSQGMALDGRTVEQIIDFYYSGAQIKTLDEVGSPSWLVDPEAIWVGLSAGQQARSFRAIGDGIEICQRGDGSDDCVTPDETLSSGQLLVVEIIGTSPLRCSRSVDGGPQTEGDCWFDIPLQTGDTTRGVEQGGQKYVRGTMHIRPNSSQNPYAGGGTLFHVAVSVDLEHYIYGIAETILSWEPAALETQAVIARSYGVSKAIGRADSNGEPTSSRKSSCWCHLSASPAIDQNYDGFDTDNEGSGTYGATWRQAVDGTVSEVVTHPSVGGGGEIISTFYSSSNGGASENNEDVWGGSPLPYLRSVVDPWSADPDVNPLANWTILVEDEDMAVALGWDYALDATVLQGPPDVLVKFTGKNDGSNVSKTLNGTQIRSILNTYGQREGGGAVRVSPYILAVTDPPGFDDTPGTLFENAIDWMRDEGITLGCNPPANTFYCPDDDVTRGEMAIFISRVLGLVAPSGDYFWDDNGKFFEGGANRMFEAGISVGCGGGKYCGYADLPREQMAVFLVRALGLPPTDTDYFTDDENSPFEDHINRIAEASITLGCNPPANDHFCPYDTVTRGEMAAFFKRAWGP